MDAEQKKKQNWPPVYVEWVDSRACTSSWEWFDSENRLGLCHVVTVGFLIYETDEYIELAMDTADGEQVMGCTTIPKVAITVMRSLNIGRKSRHGR